MAPKKTVKDLTRKVPAKRAGSVKGGGKTKIEAPRISLNHNQVAL